jgi:hypothetical protein
MSSLRYTSTLRSVRLSSAPALAALCCAGILGGLTSPSVYAKDVSAAKRPASAIPRYTLLPGGIARDKSTALEWARCALGQAWDGKTCHGEAKQYTYEAALQAVKDANSSRSVAGKSDWRLPTHRQLLGLVYCAQGTRPVAIELRDGGPLVAQVCNVDGKSGPTLVQSVFPNTPGGLGPWFWTSSPQVGIADHAWYVNFFNGYAIAGYRNNPFYLYLVRDGKRP